MKVSEIKHLHRRITAGGINNSDDVKVVEAELKELFKAGWELFATHYGGDDPARGIDILYILVK